MTAAIQAEWHGHRWGYVDGAAVGLQALSRVRSLKVVQQSGTRSGASLNYLGLEPFTCSLSWPLSAASRGAADEDFIRAEIRAWEADLGQYDTLTVGGESWHDRPLQLISVSASDMRLDARGRILTAVLTATWAEKLPEQDKARRTKSIAKRASPATEKALGIGSGADVGPSARAKRLAQEKKEAAR